MNPILDNSEQLLKEKYAEITYHSDLSYVKLCFIGDIGRDDYKEAWNNLLKYVKEKSPKSVVIDQRQIGKAGIEGRAWFVIKWIPKFKKEIDKDLKVAVITAKSITNKVGAQYIMGAVKSVSNLNIKVCQDEIEARNWFKEG